MGKEQNHQKTNLKDVLLGTLILPLIIYDMAKLSFPSEEPIFKPKKIASHNKNQNADLHQNQR